MKKTIGYLIIHNYLKGQKKGVAYNTRNSKNTRTAPKTTTNNPNNYN